MTKRASIRKADVKRFFDGAADAGVQFSRVEFDPMTGKIVGVIGTPQPANDVGGSNEWDGVLQT